MENLKLSHGSLFLLPSDTTYLSGLASQTWGLLTSAHFCSLHSSINPALLLGYLLSLRHVTSCCHPHFLTLFCSAWKVRFNPSPLSELGPPSVIPSQPLGHTAGSGQGPQVPYLLTVQRRPGTEQGLMPSALLEFPVPLGRGAHPVRSWQAGPRAEGPPGESGPFLRRPLVLGLYI